MKTLNSNIRLTKTEVIIESDIVDFKNFEQIMKEYIENYSYDTITLKYASYNISNPNTIFEYVLETLRINKKIKELFIELNAEQELLLNINATELETICFTSYHLPKVRIIKQLNNINNLRIRPYFNDDLNLILQSNTLKVLEVHLDFVPEVYTFNTSIDVLIIKTDLPHASLRNLVNHIDNLKHLSVERSD